MPGGSRPTQAPAVPEPQTAIVALPHEIDSVNTGLVEAALASALASRPAVLIADGTQTVFCDSSGVAALLRAHYQAAAAGAQLRMVVPSSQVRRVLQLIGADQLLLVYPGLADAQADGSPRPAPPPAADLAPDPERQETA
jgi:anti-sigma B factor antagonist